MAGLQVLTPPTSEPLDLATVKNFLRVVVDNDDLLITAMITAARELAEVRTGRSIAPKEYIQTLDSFPYFTDTVVSQMSYPPAYYSLPRYSTTLWNYSQMIKLFAPPLITITDFSYIDTNGDRETLDPSEFIVDDISEPARVFPGPAGSNWPSVLYVPNAVSISFLAGFQNVSLSPPMPQGILLAMMMLISNWYENRDASASGSFGIVPNQVESLLWANRIVDFQPTRG